jgi:SulP family sulfate permease
VVGIVALPLSMALAIAVQAPPQHGLYTAVVAGLLSALFGGSRTQVTGPTAAFVPILLPITVNHGLGGLAVAGLMGGLILLTMGALRLGRLIEFIPHPVTTGFTAGIAVVIAGLQLKDLLGLAPLRSPDHFFERMAAYWQVRHGANFWELGIGLFTLAVLVLLPRFAGRKVPAPLVALPLAALLVWLLHKWGHGFHAATIGTRFHTLVGGHEVAGIPRIPPHPILPWHLPGPGGKPLVLSFDLVQELLPAAFAIAMLGAIESLLSAVVADGMGRTKHDPDAELIGQGVGNLVCPFFGGIPATGALARTATNYRSGGRSPVSAMVHAITVLAAVLALAPLIAHLPMAALAALLLLVAWNMSEAKHFVHVVRVAPRSDIVVLLVCFGLTVAFDMVISVSVGVVLAALLFMRRMARLTRAKLIQGSHDALPKTLPEGLFVYDIDGPLFVGAAQKAMATLSAIADKAKVVVFRMEDIPDMDASGLVALESALAELDRNKALAVLVGIQKQPRRLLRTARIKSRFPRVRVRPDLAAALATAEAHLAQRAQSGSSTRVIVKPA